MAVDGHERRLWILMGLLALWLAAYGYSIVVLLGADQPADSAVQGLSRWAGFLGWQGVAGITAMAIWGVGRGLTKRTGIRRISSVPLGMALALVILVLVWLP